MGQSFYLSLYEKNENKYLNHHFFLYKLGEIAMNEYWYWGYIKNRPLNIGFIGDQNDRHHKKQDDSADEECNYGVASKEIIYQSDCAGKLKFEDKLPPFEWSGYLVNHTQGLYVNVLDYYERSRIGKFCLDPLAILTASNRASSLFWHGFTEGSAYSLLSSWFTDVVEWVDIKPTDINELAGLEFCELFLQSMHNEWGLTSDDYLADRNSEILYFRKDMGIYNTKLSPARCKFKYSKSADGYILHSEFEPDNGVVLVPGDDRVTFADSNGDKFDDFKEEWYGNAIVKNRDRSCTPYAEWIAEKLK